MAATLSLAAATASQFHELDLPHRSCSRERRREKKKGEAEKDARVRKKKKERKKEEEKSLLWVSVWGSQSIEKY